MIRSQSRKLFGIAVVIAALTQIYSMKPAHSLGSKTPSAPAYECYFDTPKGHFNRSILRPYGGTGSSLGEAQNDAFAECKSDIGFWARKACEKYLESGCYMSCKDPQGLWIVIAKKDTPEGKDCEPSFRRP
jgi:hypothetical protein